MCVVLLILGVFTHTRSCKRGHVVGPIESSQEAIVSRVAELQGQLAAVKEAGDYNTYLLMSQERLETMPAFERIDAWLSTRLALFEAADRGDRYVCPSVVGIAPAFPIYLTRVVMCIAWGCSVAATALLMEAC